MPLRRVKDWAQNAANICQADQESPMADDSPTPCLVCRRPLELECCVPDENGCVVHENCYKKALLLNSCAPGTYDQVEEILQQARELRETANKLLAKSDRLIETYKALMGLATWRASN